MAQIKIKRGSGVPAGLTHGELAYDVTNKRLYIGITGASALLANTDGGVSSFNGLTGAVTGVTTGNANTFQALQSFASGISASGGGTLSNGTYNFSNLKMNTVGGDEGGQIDFGLPAGSSLSTAVAFDIFQNKVRIFETGGTNRGVYIDLAGVSAGVGTNLVGGGGGAVSSVAGSGNGISVSPTTGAVVVQNTGVHSFNGLTGAVTGVTTGTANTFGPLQSFTSGISASGATFTNLIASFAYINSIEPRTVGGDLNFSSPGNVNVDNYAGLITIGDVNANVNGTTLVVRDATNTITANGQLVSGGAFTANSTITSTGIIRANAGLSAAGGTFSSLTRFTAGISAAGATLSGTINLNGHTFSSLVSSFNGSTGAVLADAVTWSVITADQTAAVNRGYFTNKATLLTLTLPTTAAVGSVIRVSGMNAGGWKIAQNASQIIHFGKTDTTTGTSGYLQNTLTRDSVEIICCVANNEWNVTSSVGNITIV